MRQLPMVSDRKGDYENRVQKGWGDLSIGAILASTAFISTHFALFLVPGRLYEQSGGEIGTAIWGTIVFYVVNSINAILRVFIWPISVFALLSGQTGFWEFLFPAFYGMPSVMSPP